MKAIAANPNPAADTTALIEFPRSLRDSMSKNTGMRALAANPITIAVIADDISGTSAPREVSGPWLIG
jgi:hypothetical protein